MFDPAKPMATPKTEAPANSGAMLTPNIAITTINVTILMPTFQAVETMSTTVCSLAFSAFRLPWSSV